MRLMAVTAATKTKSGRPDRWRPQASPGARRISTGWRPRAGSSASRRSAARPCCRSSLSGLEQAAEDRDVAEARHLVLRIAALGLEDAAQHDRLAVVHEHLRDDLARVDARHEAAGGARRPAGRRCPSLTVRSRMMRLSGVICGVTFSDSTAFLNCVVVAPLDEDSWYGISTPCSMIASRWFAVMTRGVDLISPRPSACAADSSRSTEVVGVEDRQRDAAGRVRDRQVHHVAVVDVGSPARSRGRRCWPGRRRWRDSEIALGDRVRGRRRCR